MFGKKEKLFTFVTETKQRKICTTYYTETQMSKNRYSTYEEAEEAARLVMKVDNSWENAYVVKLEVKLYREVSVVSKKMGEENVG